jgi:hypothetical protein
MEKTWEHVELELATHVQINGTIHEISNEIIKYGKVPDEIKYGSFRKFWTVPHVEAMGINIWIGDCAKYVHKHLFPILGIDCLRKYEPEPLEFVREATKNELSTSPWNHAWISLPEEAIGKTFKLIEIKKSAKEEY